MTTATLNDTLAAKLRGTAAEHKISGATLAANLGTSPLWVSRRLTGTVQITVADLVRICSGLDVDPADVLSSALPAEKAAS